MKRLLLLRHAKSSWDDPGLSDHERPLAPRGRRAAEAMAAHLRDEGIEPDLVLCSSSRRTRETLDRLSPALGARPSVSIESELYGASERELLERLNALDDQPQSVLVIGHNPGIEQLAIDLAGSGAQPQLDALRRKFPTGALATLEFERGWSELAPSSARLADFVTPKQLAKR
jgi:phosphohistidine phosphatase